MGSIVVYQNTYGRYASNMVSWTDDYHEYVESRAADFGLKFVAGIGEISRDQIEKIEEDVADIILRLNKGNLSKEDVDAELERIVGGRD